MLLQEHGGGGGGHEKESYFLTFSQEGFGYFPHIMLLSGDHTIYPPNECKMQRGKELYQIKEGFEYNCML